MAIRVTAILNLKGGVAKTTTAVNMAAILATHYGKKVLLVDADSQCNTTEFYHADENQPSLASLLRKPESAVGNGENLKQYIQATAYKNIFILPGNESLMDLDLSKVEQKELNANILRYVVSYLSDEFDYVIIDCPPAFNAACAAALIAANDVIIPIKLDAFSLKGMGNLMRQVKNMRQINPKLNVAGVLPTMWYKCERTANAEGMLINARLHLYPHIRSSARKVDDMTWEQEPLLECSPRCAAARDYKHFVAEYVGGK